MKTPVDHIIRPQLPWRSTGAITECGYDVTSVKALTRDEFLARLKDYGKQRTGLVTCMTCMQASERWPTWDDDARLAIQREVEWEGPWWSGKYGVTERHGHVLKDELHAIAVIIERHGDEFRELLQDIDDRRQWLERKAKNEKAQ